MAFGVKFARKFLYVSFDRDSFLVSDGENPMKRFVIYNYEDCVPSLIYADAFDKKTNKKEKFLTAQNLQESNYRKIPYVPVFQSVFNDLSVNVKNFRRFVEEEFPQTYLTRKVIAAIPDDSIMVDKTCIIDFFTESKCISDVLLVSAGMALSGKADTLSEHCCTLTKSARTVALSLLLNGSFIDQVLFAEDYDDSAHIKALIDSWIDRFEISKRIPVLLHGENMEAFSSLGAMVTDDALFENMKFLAQLLHPEMFP
jgi:hypothetical protein